MGEKKREKTKKTFEEDKLWFINNKMKDKRDLSEAVMMDQKNKKLERLEAIKERRHTKESARKNLINQKEKGHGLFKELHDIRKENVAIN